MFHAILQADFPQGFCRPAPAFVRPVGVTQGKFHIDQRGNPLQQVKRLEYEADLAIPDASWSSVSPATFSPSRMYSPLVGLSKQPRMLIKVDFPDPDGPMIAITSPRLTSMEMPHSACTSTSPMR
jgi:hypothetical protein